MQMASRSRFYWLNFGIPLACAVVVFLMFDLTRIDIAFNNLFFDQANSLVYNNRAQRSIVRQSP